MAGGVTIRYALGVRLSTVMDISPAIVSQAIVSHAVINLVAERLWSKG